MMNRPRPRKIINVIKSSHPAEVEEKQSNLSEAKINVEVIAEEPVNIDNTEIKPTAPKTANISDNVKTGNNSLKFVPMRKPIVATLKKAHVPPAPTFSDSPKSSPTPRINEPSKQDSKGDETVSFNEPAKSSFNDDAIVTKAPLKIEQENEDLFRNHDESEKASEPARKSDEFKPSSPTSPSLSLSGEAFLDAADRAADFIGGALLNSFKSFNLTDTSSVKISSPIQTTTKDEDDNPFAEIMKKLNSSTVPKSPNLMDEEPPESFNLSKESDPVDFVESPKIESELQIKSEPKSQIESESKLQIESEPKIESESKLQIESEIESPTIPTVKSPVLIHPTDKSISDDFEQKFPPITFKLGSPVIPESTSSNSPNRSTETFSNNSTTSVPFFDSFNNSSNSSLPRSLSPSSTSKGSATTSTSTTGFRASILKHGLSALEKIGKSTADVVVSTRNKLSEPVNEQNNQSTLNPIKPDFNDENSSFYDILKLYGGHSKLQELQIKGIRASISMKLSRQNIEKLSSFDYQTRLRQGREIAQILHPDRIMDNIDEVSLLGNRNKNKKTLELPELSGKFADEIFCIKKLLRSLDNILITTDVDEQTILVACNQRRHVICQISTVFSTILLQISTTTRTAKSSVANEISLLAADIINLLQVNFANNCEENARADRDQQVAIKLILDLSYSIVPILQQQL